MLSVNVLNEECTRPTTYVDRRRTGLFKKEEKPHNIKRTHIWSFINMFVTYAGVGRALVLCLGGQYFLVHTQTIIKLVSASVKYPKTVYA